MKYSILYDLDSVSHLVEYNTSLTTLPEELVTLLTWASVDVLKESFEGGNQVFVIKPDIPLKLRRVLKREARLYADLGGQRTLKLPKKPEKSFTSFWKELWSYFA